MDYKYDVFISYSSKDAVWAMQLNGDLVAKGLTTFLDQKRLLGGDSWEKELTTALQNSRHLAVLWSNNAEESEWVRREVYGFDMIINGVMGEPAAEKRRLIFVMLEGEAKAYESTQLINDLKDANAYNSGGPGNLAPGKWREVVDKVANAVVDKDPSTPVPLAVLSMTEAELMKIDPDEGPPYRPSLNELINELNIGSIENLKKHYGAKRLDWRPFGSTYNIWYILNDIKDKINNGRKEDDPKLEPPFRWEPIDEGFWTDPDAADRERAKLLSNTRLSLIIIDPISLYHGLIYEKFVFLSNCFNNDKSLIMVLSPQTMPSWIESVRRMVEKRGEPFFNSFFNPPVPIDKAYANCSVNIGDPNDFRRLVRAGLGYARKPPSGSTTEFLRMR